MSEWGSRIVTNHKTVLIQRLNAQTALLNHELFCRVNDGYVCDGSASPRHGFTNGLPCVLTYLVVTPHVSSGAEPIFRLYDGAYNDVNPRAGFDAPVLGVTQLWDSNVLDPGQALTEHVAYRYKIPDVRLEQGRKLMLTCKDDGTTQLSVFTWALIGYFTLD